MNDSHEEPLAIGGVAGTMEDPADVECYDVDGNALTPFIFIEELVIDIQGRRWLHEHNFLRNGLANLKHLLLIHLRRLDGQSLKVGEHALLVDDILQELVEVLEGDAVRLG